ncbi:MAG: exonuclease domain-containing protein [Burkholderiales bacterium]|nr:exonuclease domain-containing protein [Burkholderiales bacterium]MDP2397075.1 exonuclease domain-containing protein [Burkholderiales bacterium]
MYDRPLVFLDLETTGATVTHDRITEVGIVEVENGNFVREWSSLVNPGMSIPPAIQSLTGISNDMVGDAPRFEEIAREIWQAVDGRVLVAHNARFDYGFLKNEFRRLGKTFSAPVLCTVKLSRKLFPQHPRHNLDSLMTRHGIDCDARHRALGDARVLWQLAQRWREDPGESTVLEATAKLLKTATVPAGLPDNAFEHIPEGPGVYLFYGERDVPLYVGKSISLRTRVMSHFSGDHRVTKDMRIAAEVKRIDWIETAGELGALIEEARLVKKLAPVHNRQLRRASELCAWHWPAQAAAAPPQLVSARDLAGGEFRDLYGLFRSRRAAIEALRELATEHQLCHGLLGLEKRSGPCFAYQIRRCRGACAGIETAEAHALRLAAALAKLRVRAWPFPGRIGIRETAAGGERCELHVLDQWCHLGTVRNEEELRELQDGVPRPLFDLDTYKILTRYLLGGKHRPKIVPLHTEPAA